MHPVLIDFGFWRLSAYGTLVALGYLAAILWLKPRLTALPGMDEDKFWFLIYALFFGAVLGGKLLYILVSLDETRWSDLHVLRDFRYGFVFFGGFLGSSAVGVWAARRLKISYLAAADYFGAALPLGHAIGRLGCLAAGCCYGKPTSLPWAVRLGGSPLSVTPERLWGVALHPTQLYEAAANAAIAAAVVLAVLPRVRRGRLPPGSAFWTYIILYSAARFVIEFFRGDDRGWSYGGLWVSQWLSLACALAAGAAAAGRGGEAR
ncbi:MAG: prolipoprotein diacylglyceryl transferase [Elusimicrobia bacterium]|nr:prolipoprotein diacylglyceryl transferase [Elusimicrobiota bacterium]